MCQQLVLGWGAGEGAVGYRMPRGVLWLFRSRGIGQGAALTTMWGWASGKLPSVGVGQSAPSVNCKGLRTWQGKAHLAPTSCPLRPGGTSPASTSGFGFGLGWALASLPTPIAFT